MVLAVPARHPRLVGAAALTGAAATLVLAAGLIARMDPSAGLQWRQTIAWIPSIGASYDVAVTGLSIGLVVLTALLTLAALAYAGRRAGANKSHAFLFLVMETGLLGVFCAQDLLLFYVFFEIGLVPMYFIIGMFGHERRRYAAIKFFLYTRAAGLAVLLGFLALYLSVSPHTFSLPELARRVPSEAGGGLVTFAFFALVVGFAIKLPAVPLHNWLPDAHVEAPAEGSAVLAGLQLKMGGYGLVWIVLQLLPGQVERYAWVLVALALASLLYGALAALGQSDLKRLVAFTSINHMGYVLLAVGAWGWIADPSVRALAVTGAVYQMISHGLLTGGMFLSVGMLSDQTGTRELDAYAGLFKRVPIYAALFATLAVGSFGLPGMSGFIAEFQVIAAAVGANPLLAVVAVISLVITTALYVRVIARVLMGQPSKGLPYVHPPPLRRLLPVAGLAAVSIALGVIPGPLIAAIEATGRALGG